MGKTEGVEYKGASSSFFVMRKVIKSISVGFVVNSLARSSRELPNEMIGIRFSGEKREL